MGRKKARDNAFKCVYQLEFNDKKNLDINKILDYCFEDNLNSEDEKEYIKNVLEGVVKNLDAIDSIILSNLKNWTISRISKIDIAILRLAIFELKFDEAKTPIKVVANEAVELAKIYGNNDSKSFVNGLIAKVIKEMEG